MAQNSLAPGYTVLHYSVTFGTELHTHKATIPNFISGTPLVGVDPTLTDKDGDDILFSTAVDAYVTVLLELFATSTTFTHAEFWHKPTPEADPTWIYTHTLGVVGNRVGSPVEAGQLTISFRSEGGGIFKLVALETPFFVSTLDLYPFADADLTDLGAYVTGGTSFVYARDTTPLAIPIKAVGKMNDKLRRKYILAT